MKALKNTLLLVLCSLFLLSACAGLQPNKPVVTNSTPEEVKSPEHPPLDFYVKHDCWRSSFNPHEVLQYWAKLDDRQISETMLLVIVGNPKINWERDYQIGTNYSDMPVPAGEITSAVIFAFIRVDISTIELAVFGYKDKDDISYTYRWSKTDNCYLLHPAADQAACFNNNYFVAKLIDPTDR